MASQKSNTGTRLSTSRKTNRKLSVLLNFEDLCIAPIDHTRNLHPSQVHLEYTAT